MILLSLEDIEKSVSTAGCVLVAGTGCIATCLIACPFAAHIAAAPALFPFLHTCKTECTMVAASLAFRDCYGRVTVWVHVLFENRQLGVFNIAAEGSPGGRRRTKVNNSSGAG